MPVGVIIDVAVVVLGGLIGTVAGNKLSESLKDQLYDTLGLCAMCMGISTVVLVKNLPPVIFSVILGTLLGLTLKLGIGIQKVSTGVLNKVMKGSDAQTVDLMVAGVVIFCASGTGIYGALDAGITGNHSVLIAKAVLDFFAAIIFACQLGKATSLIGIPQFAVLFSLFCLAKIIMPLTNDIMVADFKACGGVILVATGLRIMKLKLYPLADMLPAMVLVMPISYAWTTWLLPLIG